jgi:hypothetical protein
MIANDSARLFAVVLYRIIAQYVRDFAHGSTVFSRKTLIYLLPK